MTEPARRAMSRHGTLPERLRSAVDWRLDMAFAPRPDGCEHGGASFTSVGTDVRALHRRRQVVAADVLDAWFPPAPEVRAVLAEDPAWTARTSPPAGAEGLLPEISSVRSLPAETLAVGAGSSDPIFRAFGHWLTPHSRVLLTDPCYGEYAHVTETVTGCRVDRFRSRREEDWRIGPDRLSAAVGSGRYDLVAVARRSTARAVPSTRAGNGPAELTSREREAVALAAQGLSHDEIAGRLVVSPSTATTHINRAMAKLHARDRARLVVLARASGLAAPRNA
ncbi:LuxR C-terminal-related transcriptional regulator [Streptomyces sp. NPDC006134]|uniref:helix-turn-helix transcriptional regulator n=1 Tax=Streptomyces sp. NPDC006134 TaxID=3154467 RepID=UPI0033FE27D6